jgi:anti-sigma factor ChrR (cupin superfamily)
MLNMDFSQFVSVDTTVMDWVPSPAPGVWRKPLAREEAERGHATSIVRYDPGASFKAHNHPLGEEILVLEGTFSDETGDFHAGTYFRNPKGFIHAPFSKEGCVILVKLHQIDPTDTQRKAIETDKAVWEERENGSRRLHLHTFNLENVLLFSAPKGVEVPRHTHDNGEEVFVISGCYRDDNGKFSTGSWQRLPPGSEHAPVFEEDSLLWIKHGHLDA